MSTFTSTVTPRALSPTGKFWGQLVVENVNGIPDDKVVLIEASTGEETTFKQLREQAHQLGVFLKGHFGLTQDDVVAVVCGNSVSSLVSNA